MKKLLSLLGAIGLVATSSATVVSCGDPDSDTTTYELGDITIDTVKGTDDNADKDMAVISDILAAVKTAAEGNKEYQAAYEAAAKDHTIDPEKMTSSMELEGVGVIDEKTTDVSKSIDITTSTYEAIKMDFDGDGTNDIDAKLTFALKSSSAPVEAKDLKDVVTTLKLGTIADKEPATILAAINKANSSSLTDEDVTIEATSDTEATVTPKEGSKLVKGDAVTVKFKIGAEDKTVELNTIIAEGTDLGEIATADEASVKAALTKNFADLKQDEITISVDTDKSTATISAKENSTVYTGSVNVTFTVKAA
jgi:hypothetical protein